MTIEEIINTELYQNRSYMVMEVTIDRPYVILKERPYADNSIEIDLGEIVITYD